MAFLHGVEVVEVDSGAPPVRTVSTGVIGLVGTALTGPVNEPVLIAGSRLAAMDRFGVAGGTIPTALDGIFDQIGARVVVVNVAARSDVASHAAVFVGDALQLGTAAGRTDKGIAGLTLTSSPVTAAEVDVGAGNAAIEVMARVAGADGNNITVALVDPGANDAPLTIDVAGQAITVNLATGAAGAVTSTNTEIVDALNAHAAASALVMAAVAAGGAADTVVAAVAATALAGGAGQAYEAESDYTLDAATGVVTRVAAGDIVAGQAVLASYSRVDLATTATADIVGDNTGDTGIGALIGAAGRGLPRPKILIAPGWSDEVAVATELVSAADRLRGVAVIDGPDTTDVAAIAYRNQFGSRRAYVVDPSVRVGSPAVTEPASARVAGVIARSDAERGFWWSPSNRLINGIVGTTRAIDFALGDQASRANTLNENEVATIINERGWRLWGNRTCSADPKWAFLSVARTADAINESILRAHLWAVDRNITRTYLGDVVEGVNNYIRELIGLGAILGGRAWADPDLNPKSSIQAGKVVISFDFTPPAPAERVTFRSILTNDYLEDLV